MFLLLLHPLDSWKVAMIFVSNIIHRVTFLFSLLFSFYWACQKFSSSCWRIIGLSRCQIKLAKCLNTACAHSISRSPGWLRRADLRVWVRARANPLISAGDDHPPPPALPRHPFNTCWAMVWPHTTGLIRWFMPHKVDNLFIPKEVVIDDVLNCSLIFLSKLEKMSLMISIQPGPDDTWILFSSSHAIWTFIMLGCNWAYQKTNLGRKRQLCLF